MKWNVQVLCGTCHHKKNIKLLNLYKLTFNSTFSSTVNTDHMSGLRQLIK